MKTLFKITLALVLGFSFNSCERDVTVDDFFAGEANFSNYVAVGNSLTAGYQDGTLYASGQANSYPAIIAQQMALIGGGNFTQPTVTDENGGLAFMGNPLPGFNTKLQLQVVNGSLVPLPIAAVPTTDVGANIAGQGPFNNLGVPGAKSFHLLGSTYGSLSGIFASPPTANPFYVRFSKPNTSVIADAVSQNPSFFSLWIGNNDVLGFATSGGDGDAITPVANFAQFYGLIAQTISSTGANGVLANIPSVTDIPYFTTIPVMSIPMTAAQAAQANAAYAGYNGLLASLSGTSITAVEATARTITFVEGANAPIFIDNSLTNLGVAPSMRQAVAGELITLPALGFLGNPSVPGDLTTLYGIGTPLPARLVLTADDISAIATATSGYNDVIRSTAVTYNWALADMNGYFKDVAAGSGLQFNGVTSTVEFVTGGLFSLDGVHPTQRGYAILANSFIDTINDHYSAAIPKVDPNQYPAVIIP